MTNESRRRLLKTGLGAAAGLGGLGVATMLAEKYGLIPPDHGGIFGVGTSLTYAAQRLLTKHSMAREFQPSQISNPAMANQVEPLGDEFGKLQAGGFADWRLKIDGMVERPGAYSLGQLRSFPAHKQITHLACEEGWSHIAEWIGVPLSRVLHEVGVFPQAKYVVYFSVQSSWCDSIDMSDAVHPQTFLTYGMNGGDLPVGNGGPLRMRVPRQLGYKSVKYITQLTVTDSMKGFGKGLGSASPEAGYSWFAGI